MAAYDAGGAYTEPSCYKRPISKRSEGKEGKKREEKVKGRKGRGGKREGFGLPKNFGVAPPVYFKYTSTVDS